uniref:Phosphoglycerate mutase-like protein n=2 Tax=Oryza TaxID=4527 RepID=A0A0D3FRS2_9ORYZ
MVQLLQHSHLHTVFAAATTTIGVGQFPRRRAKFPTSLVLLPRCTSSSSSSSGAPMDANPPTTAMYPLHRCKTIYLVRHAQGVHNVEGEKDHSAYMSPQLFDAHLTPLGWNQVDCLREHVKKSGLAQKIELVITSPLLRTMQTAVGVFGGENSVDGIENDEDVLWEPNVREANSSVAARGMKFIDWLWTREEKEIAIVSHSGFLYHTLSMYSRECHPTIREEVGKHFANCELRSMVLVDTSMLGSDSPSYNYPGSIPAGLDLPSDAAP